MSVLVTLDLKVKPENVGDLKNWLKDELHYTRAFDGCAGITIHSDQDDPNHLVFVENWDSRQHHEKYVSWRGERGDMEKLMGWLAGEPTMSYFDNVGV